MDQPMAPLGGDVRIGSFLTKTALLMNKFMSASNWMQYITPLSLRIAAADRIGWEVGGK